MAEMAETEWEVSRKSVQEKIMIVIESLHSTPFLFARKHWKSFYTPRGWEHILLLWPYDHTLVVPLEHPIILIPPSLSLEPPMYYYSHVLHTNFYLNIKCGSTLYSQGFIRGVWGRIFLPRLPIFHPPPPPPKLYISSLTELR